MADINFHPDDKVMSGQEVVKNAGFMVAVIMVFEVMFLSATAADGGVVLLVACGIPMGLIGVAVLSQSVMHFLGLGKMVMNEGTMVLRTPRSGKKREKGILAPLERIILAPLSWAVMRDMDKDGDGRISFDEMMEQMGRESKEEIIEVQELFEKHDKDGDGYLTLKELEGLIRESGDETWAEKEGNWWSEEDN
tara:strand:- start:70 stop:648 length:579 start_codon:yes stop_codon:yes gene_type:complete